MTSHTEFGKETTAEEVLATFGSRVTGKVILITGVNPNGLGAAAALALAKSAPRVIIMITRTISKAQTVVASIKSQYPETKVRFEVVQLDLSSLESVRRAAQEIRTLTDSIDIVINNAGVMAIPERTLSQDGVEMHLATNFIGHFLLTQLLIPQLKASKQARVVNITSAGSVLTPFRFSDYNFEGGKVLPAEERLNIEVAEAMGFAGLDAQTGYVPFIAYAQSNVANMLFTTQLSEVYAKDGILSYSAAPGVVVTDLQRHLPSDYRNPQMFYKTPSQGVASFLIAALDPNLSSQPSSYINDCQVAEKAKHTESASAARRLWDIAQNLIS